jgi:hypothetical protein
METLASLLNELSAELGEVTPTTASGATEYKREGRLFAVAHAGQSVELRLRPDVADAALRTPDTEPSVRGEEWVAFAAADWNDPLARDRLVAWFRLAWRAAGV